MRGNGGAITAMRETDTRTSETTDSPASSRAAEALLRAGQAESALVPSSDPIEMFGSVAGAMLDCWAVEASAELIDHEAVTRVVREPSVEPTPPVRAGELLPETQQLFAGNGDPIVAGPVLAVPIRSHDVFPFVELAPGPDFIGSLVCRYEPGPSVRDEQLAQLMVRRAVSLIHQQRHDQALRSRVANLETALSTNREIATAIGIVMATQNLSSDRAFAWLRDRSQSDNRKLRDVAADVVAGNETAA